MSDQKSDTSVRSWDQTWQAAAGQPPPDLAAPTLENAIDKHKLEFLGSFLPAGGKAVEIGCGSARLLARVGLATRLDLYGVDSSEEALRVTRQTSALLDRPITCVSGDAEKLPFDDGMFDLVLSGGLLEHFPDPTRVLSEMVRVLRPGGIFYADVVPRKLSLYRLRESLRIIRNEWMLPGVYESTYGPAFYRKALQGLGCADIRVESCGVYPPIAPRRVWNLTRVVDGTFVADWFGWYFMIAGRKR